MQPTTKQGEREQLRVIFVVAFGIALAVTYGVAFGSNNADYNAVLENERRVVRQAMTAHTLRISKQMAALLSLIDVQNAFVVGAKLPIRPRPNFTMNSKDEVFIHPNITELSQDIDYAEYSAAVQPAFFKRDIDHNNTGLLLAPHDYTAILYPPWEKRFSDRLGLFLRGFPPLNSSVAHTTLFKVNTLGMDVDLVVFMGAAVMSDGRRWGTTLVAATVTTLTLPFSYSTDYYYELVAPAWITDTHNIITPMIVTSSYTSPFAMTPGLPQLEELTGVKPLEEVVHTDPTLEPWVLRMAPSSGWVQQFHPKRIVPVLLAPPIVSAVVAYLVAMAFRYVMRTSQREEKLRQQAQLEFLGFMYHELRNPCQAQHVMLELAPSEVRQWNDYDNVMACAQLNRRLLDNALDIMKLEAGKMELARGPMHVRTVIEESAAMARVRLKHKARVDTNVADDVPRVVSCDSLRYQQVVLNLLTNAVKFCSEYARVSVWYDTTDRQLYTEVVNDGKVISDDEKEKLFQPFAQLSARIAHDYGGTGLGLTVSRGLVDLMEGALHVAGEGGETRMKFHFPCEEMVESDAIPIDEPPDADELCSTVRILFVDDNEMNRQVGQRLADTCRVGHCDLAEDGLSAFTMYQRQLTLNQPYDVVFMDLTMPVMDGWEATRKIRRHEAATSSTTHCHIVALSGSCLQEDTERAYVAGVDEFVPKPCSIPRFREEIMYVARLSVGARRSPLAKEEGPVDRRYSQLRVDDVDNEKESVSVVPNPLGDLRQEWKKKKLVFFLFFFFLSVSLLFVFSLFFVKQYF